MLRMESFFFFWSVFVSCDLKFLKSVLAIKVILHVGCVYTDKDFFYMVFR